MSLLGTPIDKLNLDELDALAATISSANFAYLMHRLAEDRLVHSRTVLEGTDPDKPGQVGKAMGQVIAYRGLLQESKALKRQLEEAIRDKRKEEESNGG